MTRRILPLLVLGWVVLLLWPVHGLCLWYQRLRADP